MIRCEHCGNEFEDSTSFCPHCGKPAPAAAESPASEGAGATLSAGAPRIGPQHAREGESGDDGSRRTIFIVVGLVAAALVAGIVWMATRPATRQAEPRLENAFRPGSPEFEQIKERLVLEFDPNQNAGVAERALGDVVISMEPTVRNFTGRTITGLELRAAAIHPSGEVMRERHVIPVPARQATLEPNGTLTFPIMFEGFQKTNVPADLKVEITGVRY